MSRIWQIAVRETRAYFLSPIAYIVITAFLFLNGYIFGLIVNAFSQPDAPPGSVMRVFLAGNVFYWFFVLLFVPVITMRLFAEERRSGTLEVLLTAPVTDVQVVLGKFFGALLFYGVLWLPTLLYVVILRRFSPLDMGPIASGYAYVLLSGAMFLSVGLLLSILTRSQIVAAILAFLVMLALFAVPLFGENLLSGTAPLHDALAYMNTWSHAGEFGKGIVDSRALVYYLSSTVVLLFLSVWTLAAKKGR